MEVRPRNPDHAIYNSRIENARRSAKAYLLDCALKKIPVNPKLYFSVGEIGNDIASRIEAKAQKLTNPRTVAKHLSVVNFIKDAGLNMPWTMVDDAWISKFEDYLRNPHPWWTFYEGYDESDVYRDRLSSYWLAELQGQIEMFDLYNLAKHCDPFSPDFEQCVDYAHRNARLDFIEQMLDYYSPSFDLQEAYELTLDCNYSIDFEDCIDEILIANTDFVEGEGNFPAFPISDCYYTPSGASTQSVTIYVEQPVEGQPKPYRKILGVGVNPGHTFITVSQSIGGQTYRRTIGYYPQGDVEPSDPESLGVVKDNNGLEYHVSVTFPLNSTQFTNLIQLVDHDINNTIDYDLNEYNCTDWAMDMVNSTGVITLPECFDTWPGGGGSNPGTLGEYLRTIILPSGATRDSNGGTAPANNCK